MISDLEKDVIQRSVQAAYLVPFIDDVEDFVWEAIWYETKGLLLEHRLARSKRLFDVVDTVSRVGWSAKTLVVPDTGLGRQVEFVIQRADIIKKQEQLGFSSLTIAHSSPQDLGDAVLAHWRSKVENDAIIQDVIHPKIAILLKNKSRTDFAVIEDQLTVPYDDEISWFWTDSRSRVGLQGRNMNTGLVQYRWYPNQTQLFERMEITADTARFRVEPRMLTLPQLLQAMKLAGHLE